MTFETEEAADLGAEPVVQAPQAACGGEVARQQHVGADGVPLRLHQLLCLQQVHISPLSTAAPCRIWQRLATL